jgi:hypothetical protein
MSLIIYQHLGLGDHIICNGLVREICANALSEKFTIVVKPTSYETIKFMFKDVPNLTVHRLSSGGFDSPESHQEVVTLAMTTTQRILYIGHGQESTRLNFDKSFYAQFEIDFKKRWDSFKVERDLTSEKNLVEKLNIKEKYIFVHEDPSRGMRIDRYIHRKGLRVIKASTDLSTNMFDYLSLIEGAEEVHVIESAFMFMIDSFPIEGQLFNHRYARSYPARNTPTLRLDWDILL